MPQIRIMSDNPAHVEQVAELLREAIEREPRLFAGDQSRVPNRRGDGIRVYFDLSAIDPSPVRASAERVDADRVDNPPPRRRAAARALPPGPTQIERNNT